MAEDFKTHPRGRSHANDRAPSREEIIALLQYPDRRIKPAALIMEICGGRLGLFEYLNYGHIEAVKKNDIVVAAKIVIYAGTNDEYFSFITPECYHAIEEYIAYRKSQGEKITKESPVIRDLFHPDKLGKGEPHLPKRLKPAGVKRMVEDALKGTGLRKPLEKGKRRHEFQADHGFRKFFKTVCEKKMKSLHVEMLMGHTTGLADSYYRQEEKELLEEYLKAVPDLTLLGPSPLPVSETIEDLKQRIVELEEKAIKSETEKKEMEKMFEELGPQVEKRVLAKVIQQLKGFGNSDKPRRENRTGN